MSHALFNLQGRVAVVSGAASGLGKAMATALAEVGADVVLADINRQGVEQAADGLQDLGVRALPVECDMSEPEQIRALFEQVDSAYGRVDILGNVAGNARGGDPLTVGEVDVEFTMKNLIVGRLVACQEAARRMVETGRGSIINLISIAGMTALGRNHLPYSMGMAGAAQMTRELSTEWSGRGVRVNGIVCAQIMNAGLEARIAADPKLGATYLRGIPIGRLGQSDDIKGVSIFLASDASAWITGALIPLDGGNLAKNAGGSHHGMPDAPDEQR